MASSPSRRSCAGPHDQLGRNVDREVDVVTAQQAEHRVVSAAHRSGLPADEWIVYVKHDDLDPL
jgi:hypothetical protein